jgi:hypothetical protein
VKVYSTVSAQRAQADDRTKGMRNMVDLFMIGLPFKLAS